VDGNRDLSGFSRAIEEAGGADSSQKCLTPRDVHRKAPWEIHTQWENNTAAGDGTPTGCPTSVHLTPTLAELEGATAITRITSK